MEVRTKTTIENKNSTQYVLAIVIALLFGLGLIPGLYFDIGGILVAVLLIQILISLIRFNFLHLILELVILILSLFSFIPFLGYLFRLLGFIFAMLDMVTFKNTAIYNQVNIRFDNSFSKNKKKKVSKKKPQGDVVDADFKEK